MKMDKIHTGKIQPADAIKEHRKNLSARDEPKIIQDQVDLKKTGKPSRQKEWTVLVYSSGTRDIDDEVLKAAQNLEKTGSDENVSVILQLGRNPIAPYGEKDVRRYYINRYSYDEREAPGLQSPCVENLGEIDMSDPQNLENFISWGMKKYPARRTALVLGGHGAGFLGAITDNQKRSLMPIPEIEKALVNSKNETGKKVDLLVFNSCFLAQVEPVSQFRNSADFIVASETPLTGTGFPLKEFIQKIQEKAKDGKDVSTEQAGAYLVDSTPENQKKVSVFSLIDTSRFSGIEKAVDNLARELINADVPRETIIGIIKKTPSAYSDENYPPFSDYRDLYGFARRVSQNPGIKSKKLKRAASRVMDSINETLKSKNFGHGLNGISIYLPDENPEDLGPYQYGIISEHYERLNFSSETSWWRFIKKLYPPRPKP